jgi:hypothetical protein
MLRPYDPSSNDYRDYPKPQCQVALAIIRRTAFDGPLLPFLLSAALGAGLAYDQVAGWSKFLLIVE